MLREPLRQHSRGPQGPSGDPVPLPAPTGGWDAVSPLAKMKPDRAVVLDNWFPSTGFVEVRKGHKIHGSGMGSAAVPTLMVYSALTAVASKLFAVTGGTIYDVTANAGATATSVTGLSTSRLQSALFSIPSGHYLVAVSGGDAVRNYNGTVWSSPSITGSGITSSDFINVNVHKNRLWFVIKDSLDAAYLPTDAISGVARKFNLGSNFKKGGFLVAMATWTQDGGWGPDDYAVFITSEGQVAIYKGTDPSDVDFWSLIGVFDLGKPLGYRCFTKVAGDLALINIDGVLPLSRALGVDRGAVAQVAITANINTAMNKAARSYSANFGWELTAYAKGVMALLNVPIQEGQTQHQYVMNTLTGAWCRFLDLNANCWAVFRDNLYFGGNDGLVYQADTGAVDIDQPIDAVGQCAYNNLGEPGRQKQVAMLQPLITTDSNTRPALGVSTDFADNATLGTPSSAETSSALYDVAVWDDALYPVEARNIADWTAVACAPGQAISVHFRSRIGSENSISIWGVAEWGGNPWSISNSGDVVMQLNGFNAIHLPGSAM